MKKHAVAVLVLGAVACGATSAPVTAPVASGNAQALAPPPPAAPPPAASAPSPPPPPSAAPEDTLGELADADASVFGSSSSSSITFTLTTSADAGTVSHCAVTCSDNRGTTHCDKTCSAPDRASCACEHAIGANISVARCLCASP